MLVLLPLLLLLLLLLLQLLSFLLQLSLLAGTLLLLSSQPLLILFLINLGFHTRLSMSLLTMFGVGVGGQTGEGRREVVTFITVLKKKTH